MAEDRGIHDEEDSATQLRGWVDIFCGYFSLVFFFIVRYGGNLTKDPEELSGEVLFTGMLVRCLREKGD